MKKVGKKRKIHAWFGLEKGINDTALHPSPFAGAARLAALLVARYFLGV